MPFQTSAEERSQTFQSNLSIYETTVKNLKTEMQAHVKGHTSSAARNKVFGDKLGTIGRREHFEQVSEVYSWVRGAWLETSGRW